MAIELSNLTFTDENNIVFASEVEQIVNTEVANTLAVNDIIGTSNHLGFENVSVLSTDDSNTDDGNTDDGNDTLIGIENLQPEFGSSYDAVNSGTLSTDEDNDILTGTASHHNWFRDYSRLTIHSIKCLHNGADRFGPDDTYIRMYGTRIWGDYNMRGGQTHSVNYSTIQYRLSFEWIELFDKDNSWSRDDSMGGFHVGQADAFNPDTGIAMKQVHGSGSTYEVYYSFVPLQQNPYSAVSVATSEGGNVLMPFEP